ncbi:MAG: DUF4340 domain-containing protein [Candidatus Aminicenantes bacterium]|nr:DUF4340 domain-containing protein [Candidatus Aminicenantes bacterium]
MKLKKEYLLPAVIIVILLGYLIVGTGKNKMSYEIPRLKPIPSGEIDKIEITQTTGMITIAGKEKTWSILPQEYSADPTKVQDMLESIENLTLSELAAEKQDYQRYDLTDDKKIQVKAFKGSELVRKFDIGKTSSTYRHTFIRIQDDSRVFYARESFRSNFAYEIKDLRHKVVMTLDKNEISGVNIEQEDTLFEFTKQMIPATTPPETEKTEEKEGAEPESPVQTEEEAWVLPDGNQANKGNLEAIISSLVDLRCDEFLEGQSKEDLKDPIYSVTAKGGKDYSLQIFAKQEQEGGKYPAISSENLYPFLLSTYKAEQIMKKPDELAGKKED